MQTYLVHMRRPAHLYKDLGACGFFGFQIVFGGILVAALLHPVFILWTGYALFQQITGDNDAWFGGLTLQVANFFIFFAGYFFSMLAGAYALDKRGYHSLITAVFYLPIYWLLVSVGAYLGLWQLIFRPFYWEKTSHGRKLSVEEKAGG
jgi:cytosine/uracil/thiamine/allantoin permease